MVPKIRSGEHELAFEKDEVDAYLNVMNVEQLTEVAGTVTAEAGERPSYAALTAQLRANEHLLFERSTLPVLTIVAGRLNASLVQHVRGSGNKRFDALLQIPGANDSIMVDSKPTLTSTGLASFLQRTQNTADPIFIFAKKLSLELGTFPFELLVPGRLCIISGPTPERTEWQLRYAAGPLSQAARRAGVYVLLDYRTDPPVTMSHFD